MVGDNLVMAASTLYYKRQGELVDGRWFFTLGGEDFLRVECDSPAESMNSTNWRERVEM